jgi:hypothetical protein
MNFTYYTNYIIMYNPFKCISLKMFHSEQTHVAESLIWYSNSLVKHALFTIYGVRKNFMPKLREVREGTKTKTYCQSNTVRSCILAVLRTIKSVLTMFGNKPKPLNYSETESCVLNQFRADVQTYDHRPRYTADNDAPDNDVCYQKCQFCTWLLLKSHR